MGRYRFIKIFTLFGIILLSSWSYCEIDNKSIFVQAQQPVSELDFILFKQQMMWQKLYYRTTPEYIKNSWKERFPLIAKAKVFMRLYRSNESEKKEKIKAVGVITKIDSFLSLTLKERKKLLREVLKSLELLLGEIRLSTKNLGNIDTFSRQYIKLTLTLDRTQTLESIVDDKGDPVYIILPLDLKFGYAGYVDGQFVYSQDYYLNLQMVGGKAKFGDPSNFVIERE